ncbi:MAG: ATP-binding cassette domain-containing protein [Rhodobacterales bacterium]|nr:ATP-binding cassette domain-containing protein [Rhodobacterales bacterium]NCT11470.1 ATP-binding cassette domain-containing protein [Rhodobacterales bacterium]
MLRLDGLRLAQGDFALAADLVVQGGATVAVMGPSGGGKSTLLSVIAGFLAPVAGRVLWGGADITALPPAARPVSILFQDNNLFPHLTIAQNIGLALRPALRLTAAEADRVEDVLVRVGLAGLGTRRPAALSGGQQSRAALARLLVAQKPLVLLDEPFAALGPALRAEMLDLCAQTLGGQGRTLLMVTHDPQDARRIASDVMAVEGGEVSAPAPTAQVLDHPPPGLRAYLGKE